MRLVKLMTLVALVTLVRLVKLVTLLMLSHPATAMLCCQSWEFTGQPAHGGDAVVVDNGLSPLDHDHNVR